LRAAGVNDSTNALGSHSYRRVCEYLRGERTLESAVEQSKQDVRNYAKRQLTWFRREKVWLWLDGFGNQELVVQALVAAVRDLNIPLRSLREIGKVSRRVGKKNLLERDI
jgi:tRNA dimethylallyltransferase